MPCFYPDSSGRTHYFHSDEAAGSLPDHQALLQGEWYRHTTGITMESDGVVKNRGVDPSLNEEKSFFTEERLTQPASTKLT